MIRSITDAEMEEKILSETLEKTLSLEEIVKLAQNIESAKLSSGLILKNGPEANKISEESTEKPKFGKCGHCGSRHKGESDQESRKKFCWAWKLSCNKCKAKFYIARVCKSSGKRWESRQMAYCAEGCNRLFLSKQACVELGILEQDFPKIGRFDGTDVYSNEESEDEKDESRVFSGKCEPFINMDGEEA